jgi:hypothetical protein
MLRSSKYIVVVAIVLVILLASVVVIRVISIRSEFPGVSGKESTIDVAASNSSSRDKAVADYVCTGTSDEVTIREAINKTLSLSNAWSHYGSTTTVVMPYMNYALFWYDGATYHAYGADSTYSNILHTISTDGTNWELGADPIMISKGRKGSWDSATVAVANVWNEGSKWYMLYRGTNNRKVGVGLATASSPKGPWSKSPLTRSLVTVLPRTPQE